MSDETKIAGLVVGGIVALAVVISASMSYYYIHRPPIEACKDVCGMPGMMKSYDAQDGCVCR